jgi:hypothetical protein
VALITALIIRALLPPLATSLSWYCGMDVRRPMPLL